jgi:hypothetical protein
MEPGDHARFDIDRKGQPGTPNGLQVFAMDDDRINQSVIYLDYLQGALLLEGRNTQWTELARSLSPVAAANSGAGVNCFRPPSYGAIVRDC